MTTQVNLGNVLSKRSQTQKATGHLIPFIGNVGRGTSLQTERSLWSPGTEQKEKWGGVTVSWGDENVLGLNSGDGYTTL